jgi:hypothetical protein
VWERERERERERKREGERKIERERERKRKRKREREREREREFVNIKKYRGAHLLVVSIVRQVQSLRQFVQQGDVTRLKKIKK